MAGRETIVTSASRDGDQPGRPRSPNAAANCSSSSHWPSRSRTCTASGRGRLPESLAAIAAAISGSGSGQAAGCLHMTYPILRPGRGGRTTASQIMAPETTQIEHARGMSRINHQDQPEAQNRGAR
jgi:hypothetical protein